jgi:hypothetical protein
MLSQGDHSLLNFAYTCVRDLFIGGVIYLAQKIIRWWYFTCKKHENIICDGILHVNMFHYFKIPYLHVHFLQNLTTMNILDLIFYRILFYNFRPLISPSMLQEHPIILRNVTHVNCVTSTYRSSIVGSCNSKN